ncbi:MAG TPA: hypothetical protein VGQ65_08565 [Thermoanaerobaculia bacterium]|nr:hypothetical protein [Thermoanaerobaculia bacterium]
MTDWWKKLVLGSEGNVIRERSFTNWNTFDASQIVAEKEREKASSAAAKAEANEGGDAERD